MSWYQRLDQPLRSAWTELLQQSQLVSLPEEYPSALTASSNHYKAKGNFIITNSSAFAQLPPSLQLTLLHPS